VYRVLPATRGSGTLPGVARAAHINEAIDVFKFGTLAQIEDLPGFCNASLLVNRDEGRRIR
jgi:hypothetical protein